jgi:hypothetical protein
MAGVLARVAGVWFVMLAAAILNGLLRDYLLTPLMGTSIALPVSGLVLSFLVLLIAWLLIPFTGVARPQACLLLGLFWVVLTLAFEYLFGHYVAGRPWQDIHRIFNPIEGDLFSVVLVVTALSPWLAARLRGLF